MSFNYLEIERAITEIQPVIQNAVVEEVALVSWKLSFKSPKELSDLNLGLKIKNNEDSCWLVFCLRQPWCGIFLAQPDAITINKNQNWGHVFDFTENVLLSVIGKKILSIETINQDRIIKLVFQNTALNSTEHFIVECFPARPNWIFKSNTGVEISWRKRDVKSLNEDKPIGFIKKQFFVREFEDENNQKIHWLERAKNFYLNLRKNSIYDELFLNIKNKTEEKLTHLIKLKSENHRLFEESKKQILFKTYGEAILGSKHLIKDLNSKKIELPWGDETLVISLDPKLSISENANKYFLKYKKLKRSVQELESRKLIIDQSLQKNRFVSVELEKYRRKQSDNINELLIKFLKFIKEIGINQSDSVTSTAKNLNKTDKKIQTSGIKKYLSKEGLAILVGRNHIENEDLVMHIARGNDLWFHVKARPGAHVIVQIPKNKTASLDSMLDAATLVAHYSGIQDEVKIEVDYTFKKYLKRISGKKNDTSFNVIFSQNKTLSIKVERERLARLLTSYSLP